MGILNWLRYLDIIFSVGCQRHHVWSLYIDGRVRPNYLYASNQFTLRITEIRLKIKSIKDPVAFKRIDDYVVKQHCKFIKDAVINNAQQEKYWGD